VTVREACWPPLRIWSSHSSRLSEPMTPRFRVTSVALLRPVILRTLFSFSLPVRYSATVTSMPTLLHSWKPAWGPSVTPVPRSTRKLNWTYGGSRRTAISLSPLSLLALGVGRPLADPEDHELGGPPRRDPDQAE